MALSLYCNRRLWHCPFTATEDSDIVPSRRQKIVELCPLNMTEDCESAPLMRQKIVELSH
jgi:hypothetical protein